MVPDHKWTQVTLRRNLSLPGSPTVKLRQYVDLEEHRRNWTLSQQMEFEGQSKGVTLALA